MRHCEESDDEAIQNAWIAARPLDRLGVARNDACVGLHKPYFTFSDLCFTLLT